MRYLVIEKSNGKQAVFAYFTFEDEKIIFKGEKD